MTKQNEEEDLGAVIKGCDMDEELKLDVISTTLDYMNKCFTDQEIASKLKAKYDEEQKPTWQCIVGRHFGSVVTHEMKNYIYFYIGQMGIVLFKSG